MDEVVDQRIGLFADLIWAVVSGSWFCLYVWTVDKGRARAGKPGVQRVMQAATGVTMLGLGIVVAIGS